MTHSQKIQRTNWYGNGSWCIGDAFARCGFKVTPDLDNGRIVVKRSFTDRPKDYVAFGVSFKTRKSQKLTFESLLLKDRGIETDLYFAEYVDYNLFLLDNRGKAETFLKNIINEAKERRFGKRVGTYDKMVRFSERALNKLDEASETDVKKAQEMFYEHLYPNKDRDFDEFLKEIPERLELFKSQFDFSNSLCFPRFSDSYLAERDEQLKRNYEINMNHFNSLDKVDFNKYVDNFLIKAKRYFLKGEMPFVQVTDLNDKMFEYPGYYVLVLDEYKQVYVGRANNIRKRIVDHWTRILPYNQRLFGPVETSKLSIDSFGSEDVTRIYAKVDFQAMNEVLSCEDKLIKLFPNKYTSNRIEGGLPGFDGDVRPMAKRLGE